MNIVKRILRFLFPPSRWQGCHRPSDAQRLAAYEVRMGEHRAQQRLRAERIAQQLDAVAIVRTKVTPRLPADNVVQIRRRKL